MSSTSDKELEKERKKPKLPRTTVSLDKFDDLINLTTQLLKN
ncbi:MAG: hypothetical protein ACTSPZ_07930 [Promethearchaeota archaeon]